MFNKELIENIINLKCSLKELEDFNENINKKEYDLDNPFKKYYALNKVLHAIERYEKNEVNKNYLAYWMNAYDWILMGGFKLEEGKDLTFKKWVKYEISEWLDSLSFFDADDTYKLKDYRNTFTILDKMYLNADDWSCVYAYELDDDYAVVLAFNNKTKEFIKTYSDISEETYNVKLQRVDINELENKANTLINEGYNELEFGAYLEN